MRVPMRRLTFGRQRREAGGGGGCLSLGVRFDGNPGKVRSSVPDPRLLSEVMFEMEIDCVSGNFGFKSGNR